MGSLAAHGPPASALPGGWRRPGIRHRLFAAFGAVAAIAAVLGLYALFSFHHLGSGMRRLAYETMPRLIEVRKTVDAARDLQVPLQSLAYARTEAERSLWFDLNSELVDRLEGVGSQYEAPVVDFDQLVRNRGNPLAVAVQELNLAVGARNAAIGAHEADLGQASVAFLGFTEALRALERRTRTVAILTLSITLPEARTPEALQARVSDFIAREMSWLATVQDVRSIGNDILSAALESATASEPETLARLRERAQTAAARLQVLTRLPASPEVTTAEIAVQTLTEAVFGHQGDVFALRWEVIEAERTVRNAFVEARRAAVASHANASGRASAAGDDVHDAVTDTLDSIRWSERLVAGFAVLASIAVFVILRRYVTQDLLARLNALKVSMLAGAADPGTSAPRILKDLTAITASRRDEITEMANSLAVFVQVITDREQALREASHRAEIANRTKSQFLANMSHELRTPLNAILGFSEVIKDGRLGSNLDRYREYAGDIHRSGAHLLAIISDVLDLSKIEAGRLDLNESDVAVAAIVKASARLVAELATDKRIFVGIEIAENMLVRGDELRLKQVFLNLLSNAVKFTPTGGRIVIAAHRSELDETLIAVADNGVGMAPDEIAVALQPFRQVDASRAKRHDGTGLGLPLAKRLVELHGGRFELDSAPNLGTTARVILPPFRAVPAQPHPGDVSNAETIVAVPHRRGAA